MWKIFKKKIKLNKYEFVQENVTEINMNGTHNIINYFTRKNGHYIGRSISRDKDTALKIFELIKQTGTLEKEIVLITEYI